APLLSIRAGDDISDLFFQMLPAAVITGKVLDEDGEPLANCNVSLLRRQPGKSREPAVVAIQPTNDLREYPFGGLFPGPDLVEVVPPPDTRNFDRRPADSSETPARQDLNYLVNYYPGTPDFMQASTVSVRAGDELPVNFLMIPGRTYRIRGMVTGIPANQK